MGHTNILISDEGVRGKRSQERRQKGERGSKIRETEKNVSRRRQRLFKHSRSYCTDRISQRYSNSETKSPLTVI